MASRFIQSIEQFKHPVAVIGLDGEVIRANDAGYRLIAQVTPSARISEDQLKAGKPFRLLLENGLMIQATPLKDGSGFLLEWKPLSEAETRLALFQAVSKSVNSSLILEEIFESLSEVLWTFIPYEAGSIIILDESQNSTKVIVSLEGFGQAKIRGDNNIFTGYDAVINQLLAKPQSQLLSYPFQASILIHPESPQAILVPLINKGMVIGCIGLSGRGYTQIHVQRLEEVSEQLAIAVENARLYWQTQSQAGREFLINQITKAIRQSLDIQEILQTTAREVGKVLGLSRCIIHYWGAEASKFEHFEYVLPGISQLSNPYHFAQFERELFHLRSSSIEQYNPFILNDIRSFDRGKILLDDEKIKSLAIFPILLQEKTFVGTINLHQCDTYRAWLNEEIELMKAIAEHVSVALHQANLFQEQERQRKQLEETLNELQQTQMHLVQSEKMAVLGQFVAGIAHEINTPLGTLISNDDTVKRCLEHLYANDDKSEKYRLTALELLKINRLASERIMDIVRNLRNFARLDESDLKRVDLHAGLDSTLLLIESSLKPAIQIVKNYGDIPLVECFPGLLNQVFMNLLVNAIHSIEDQGCITIETSCFSDLQQVHVAIRDTGKGIAPDNLCRIFDPGFTTKGVGVGTGLGLALCYKIMEKHHGRIDVESTPGEGTTMTVILPANPS